MAKWEYCAVVGVSSDQHDLLGYFPAIWYFTAKGVRVVEIKGDEARQIGAAIARLGQEGWELVTATSPYGEGADLYFRRATE